MIHKTRPVVAHAVTILWGAGSSEGAVYKFYRKLKKAASKHDITCAGSHDIPCAGSHDITYTVLWDNDFTLKRCFLYLFNKMPIGQ